MVIGIVAKFRIPTPKSVDLLQSHLSYPTLVCVWSAALLFGKQRNESGAGQIGCIDPFCNVVHVIEDAAANARFLCDRYYLGSPALEITQVNGEYSADRSPVSCETR